jgi:biuret amidohydrolase
MTSIDLTDLGNMYSVIHLKEQVAIEIDPGSAALFVIDEQRYFTEPGHPLGRIMEQIGAAQGYFDRVDSCVLPNTRRLLDAFRSNDWPIYFTAFGTAAGDGSDLPPYMQGVDALGLQFIGERVFPSPADESWRIDERVAPMPGEVVLRKHTASPFVGTSLDEEIHGRDVKWIVIAGLVTECCVGQTARDAAERGFQVILVEDGCTGISASAHRILVDAFASIFGHRRSTAAVLDLLGAREDLPAELPRKRVPAT